MSEDLTVISIAFSHAGADSLVELTYGEERDQSEEAGIIKNASARIASSQRISDLSEQIQELGEELVAAIYAEVHKPAPTRPSRLGR